VGSWDSLGSAMGTILIPIVSGSRVRNFLRTDLLKELHNNADIVIASPAYNDGLFLAEFGHPGVYHEAYYPKTPRRRIEAFLQTLETWFPNSNYASTETYEIVVNWSHSKILAELRKLQMHFLRTKLGAAYAGFVRALLRELDFLLTPATVYRRPFDRHNPSIVLTDYPIHYCYRPLLKMAHKRKIPILCLVTSWDNFTSKGELPLRVDRLIVWNQIMKREAMDLYGYDTDEIFISGAPQFDIYFRSGALMPRDQFLRRLGFDPKKRVLTYCTQGMSEYETLDFEVVTSLLSLAREHNFGDECQLLIRLHPGRSGERFLGLRGKNVYVDCPGHSELWLDGWNPDGADAAHLANILHSSDVVINITSTITIDACCLDRPVINVAFDADHPRSYWKSVARCYDFTHYKNIVQTGGVRVARSKDELREHVQAYLENSRLDADGRKRIVSEQCYYTDGRSAERVARFVLDFLRSTTN
jgi:hypothetical protein